MRRYFAECLFCLVVTTATVQAQEGNTFEAASGRATIVTEIEANVGTDLLCEFDVKEIASGSQWASLISIAMDEGKETDQDSRYVQLNMTYQQDEDQTVTLAIRKLGFGADSEEYVFLGHWQRLGLFELQLEWTDEGFNYYVSLPQEVVAFAEIDLPDDFKPKYFRAGISGLRTEAYCE